MIVLVKKADGEYELTDIEPDEISFVDRAANKRKFIVVKRDGATGGQAMAFKLTKEEKDTMVKAMADIKDRVDGIEKGITEAEEVDAVEKSDRAGIDTLIKALEEKLAELKKKDGDDKGKTQKKTVECPKCAWKGEMPDNGKCPKCMTDLTKQDGNKSDKDEATKALLEKIEGLKAEVEKLKVAKSDDGKGDGTQDADPMAEVKKSLDTLTAKVEGIEKRNIEVFGSSQGSGDDAGGGDKSEKWGLDIAQEMKDEEEAKRAEKK